LGTGEILKLNKGEMIMKCKRCNIEMKKRKNPPYTATTDGGKYFDYYQCPKCKVNHARPKK